MNVAVVFAGGTGSRMQSATTPKQFLKIHGKTILEHTLENFENHPQIDAIAVACLPTWIPYVASRLDGLGIRKVRWIVPGGPTSQDSVYNALSAVAADVAEDTVVLIHDGVRPLISEELISLNIESVLVCGNAVTLSPAWETITSVTPEGIMAAISDRQSTRIAKAPQSFRLGDLLAAHEDARARGRHDYTDSASLMAESGVKLHGVPGAPENIKVTTAVDFYILRAILDARETQQIFG